MIDPAGITQRGAEQSAPRSRSGLSTVESHGVSRLRQHLVASHAREQSPLAFERQPPGAWWQVERRMGLAELRAHNGFTAGACGAVERLAKTRSGVGVPPCGVGGIGAQLRAESGGATARPVARLTSARRDSHPRHVGVVSPGVFRRATIASREALRVAVERIASAPKCGVE